MYYCRCFLYCVSVFIFCLTLAPACHGEDRIKLPAARVNGKMSVEAAIVAKKSVRTFSSATLDAAQVSQMLWAANGNLPQDTVAGATTKVIPSAGGLYALEVFLVTGNNTVAGIPAGMYRYDPQTNSLQLVAAGDNRNLLAYASLGQTFVARAPAIVVIAGMFERSTVKYGPRGYQYTYMEAGSANQNMYLQAESLGLRMATVGAFDDAQVAGVLKLPANIKPLLVIPVGK
ncbi:MAG TPA: SagB/ThcOx family dehydrogenase [Desulfomonilaceae bacterium]|nr:SagB/ThcOx family dehydrogenase [Desulfomonilaceae bacterium]